MLIKGGPAGSGRKRGKDPKPGMWTCSQCEHHNAGHWITCPTAGCREKRPR